MSAARKPAVKQQATTSTIVKTVKAAVKSDVKANQAIVSSATQTIVKAQKSTSQVAIKKVQSKPKKLSLGQRIKNFFKMIFNSTAFKVVLTIGMGIGGVVLTLATGGALATAFIVGVVSAAVPAAVYTTKAITDGKAKRAKVRADKAAEERETKLIKDKKETERKLAIEKAGRAEERAASVAKDKKIEQLEDKFAGLERKVDGVQKEQAEIKSAVAKIGAKTGVPVVVPRKDVKPAAELAKQQINEEKKVEKKEQVKKETAPVIAVQAKSTQAKVVTTLSAKAASPSPTRTVASAVEPKAVSSKDTKSKSALDKLLDDISSPMSLDKIISGDSCTSKRSERQRKRMPQGGITRLNKGKGIHDWMEQFMPAYQIEFFKKSSQPAKPASASAKPLKK